MLEIPGSIYVKLWKLLHFTATRYNWGGGIRFPNLVFPCDPVEFTITSLMHFITCFISAQFLLSHMTHGLMVI
jgi:hypothetical protein